MLRQLVQLLCCVPRFAQQLQVCLHWWHCTVWQAGRGPVPVLLSQLWPCHNGLPGLLCELRLLYPLAATGCVGCEPPGISCLVSVDCSMGTALHQSHRLRIRQSPPSCRPSGVLLGHKVWPSTVQKAVLRGTALDKRVGGASGVSGHRRSRPGLCVRLP